MNVLDQARVIIYRVNQKGLEILLVNTGDQKKEQWSLPTGLVKLEHAESAENMIELEPVQQQDGQMGRACAIEGDWHEIPSIRQMIKDDVRIVKDQIKQHIPELEQGTYFAVKEAFRKVLPEEYAALKELKDIVLDRNQAKYI